MILRYCIRTCTQRQDLCEDLYKRLRAHLPSDVEIDIVNDTIGREPILVFMMYLEKLLSSGAVFDHLVTLEDDAIFNDFLHENLLNYKPLQEPKVGCLQLSLSSKVEIASPYTLYSYMYDFYFRTAHLHYSCGLTFSRGLLESIDIPYWLEKKGLSFDNDMTQECHNANFLHLVHYPSLVATKKDTTSALGHVYAPDDDVYSQTWRFSEKDDVYRAVKATERLFGFQRKNGEPDQNPMDRSLMYMKYLEEEVATKMFVPIKN